MCFPNMQANCDSISSLIISCSEKRKQEYLRGDTFLTERRPERHQAPRPHFLACSVGDNREALLSQVLTFQVNTCR